MIPQGSAPSAIEPAPDPEVMKRGRGLTEGELALLKPIFGDSIDYGKVKLYGKKWAFFQGKNVAMSPNGKVYFPSESGYYRADFSRASASMQALFVHEMTHVWQHQRGVNVVWKGFVLHVLSGADPYKYALETRRALSSYNIEQQASIVEDLFVLRKFPQYAADVGITSSRADYEKVVGPIKR